MLKKRPRVFHPGTTFAERLWRHEVALRPGALGDWEMLAYLRRCLECGGKCRDGVSGGSRLTDQAARSMTASVALVASVCQPSTLRMVICPDASSAQNNMAAVSATTVWVLMRRLNSSSSRSTALVCAPAPLAGRQASEGEQPVTRFLQAVGDRPALQPPLAQEGLAPLLDLFRGFGVDHVGIVAETSWCR